MYTQYSVEEADWLEEKERTKKNQQINAHLSAMETEVHEIVRKLREEKKSLLRQQLKIFSRIKKHQLHMFFNIMIYVLKDWLLRMKWKE